jgi:hypothetical protein
MHKSNEKEMTSKLFTEKNLRYLSNGYFIYALFLIAFLIIYFPVVSGYYLYADDYLFLFPKSEFGIDENGFWINKVSKDWLIFSVSTGKPLYFLFIMLANLCIENLGSANWFRLGAIAGLALFCTLNWVWLVRHQFQSFEAFIISLIIGSLPAMNLTVAWITMSGVLPSLILSSLAALIVFKSMQASTGIARNSWRCIAVFCMVAALSTYQLSAMYYWVMVAVILLSIELKYWKQSRGMIAKYFLIGIVSMVIYIFVGRIIPHILGVGVSSRGGLDIHLLDKIGWFISSPTFSALNFIYLLPTLSTAFLVSVVISAGIIIESKLPVDNASINKNLDTRQSSKYTVLVKLDSFDRWVINIIALGGLIAIEYLFWQVARSQLSLPWYTKAPYLIAGFNLLAVAPLYIKYYSFLQKNLLSFPCKVSSFADEHLSNVTQKWLIIFLLILLCCSTFLLASGGKINGHRALIAYSPFVVFLLFNGYKRIKELANTSLRVSIQIAFVIFAIHCAWRANYVAGDLIARPQSIEARHMILELKRNYSGLIREIHVFRPNWWTGMVPITIPIGTEIGVYSSSVSSNTKNMVLCMINELGEPKVKDSPGIYEVKNIKITSSIRHPPQSPHDNENDPSPETNPSVLFIDMLTIK